MRGVLGYNQDIGQVQVAKKKKKKDIGQVHFGKKI
jgi:hypothetical protein